MDSSNCRSRLLVCLLAILATLTLMTGTLSPVCALGPVDCGPSSGLLSPLSRFDFGNLNLRTAAAVGYQSMGLNFNLPALLPEFGPATIDLSVKRANMWVGWVGFNIDCFRKMTDFDCEFAPFISVFLKATANAQKSVQVVTTEDPLPGITDSANGGFLIENPPVSWPVSGLQWWLIDGGALYQCSRTMGIMAGLRRDYLSFKFNQDFAAAFPLGAAAAIDYTGDFSEKLWEPYLGIQLNGTNYRASLIWSPWVSVSLKVPLSASSFVANPVPPAVFVQVLEGFQFSVFNPGALLEGNFEYSQELRRGIYFGIWGNASWLRIRDNGKLAEQINVLVNVAGSPPVVDNSSDSGRGTATLTRSIIAGGIMAEVKF